MGKINAEQYAKDLAKHQGLWEAGNANMWAALHQTIYYCQFFEIALPEWAAVAMVNLIQEK